MDELLYINIHCHSEDLHRRVITLRSISPGEASEALRFKWLTVGLHPWHIHLHDTNELLKQVEIIAQHDNVVAIGEAGLDRNTEASLSLQEDIFSKQALIAERIQKPLIIHCVRCYPELMAMHKLISPKMDWIIHGFRGNQEIAYELIKRGIYLSFGAALTGVHKNIKEVFSLIPNNRIFLETDESNLSIEDIYKKAALLKNISLEEMKQIITNNFNTVFKDNEKGMA